MTRQRRDGALESKGNHPALTVMVWWMGFAMAVAVTAAAVQPQPPGLRFSGHALPGLDAVEQVLLPAVDTQALLAEDAVRDRQRDRPMRFAQPVQVELSSERSGTWQELDNGWLVWCLRLSSPGALSMSVGLTRFELPEGGQLWVHDGVGELVQGPYTPRDRTRNGGLWPAMVLGDELVIEVLLPAARRDELLIEVGRVNHGYRLFGERRDEAKQGRCNIDVACSEGDGWRRQIRSVAWYTLEGYETCSGVMVNNTSGDLKPYFLTAWHCGITARNDSTMVVYWNYQSPSCGRLGGGSLAQNQSGATLRAELDDWQSDFALVELDRKPDASFSVYYAGWDATGATPSGAVGIHHPDTREKAISIDDDPLRQIWGTHWDVSWDRGVTEPGSSGSPLFDSSSGLVVGTLTSGESSCATPHASDQYGKVSLSYVGDGRPGTRLSDWLDPGNTGKQKCLGKESSGTAEGPAPTWLVPAAASTPGASPADDWRSQLTVINTAGSARTVNIHYVASGAAWPGSKLSGPHLIQAGRSLYFDDPLKRLNPTSGLLYLTADGGGTLVSSRVYNRRSGGATFGQAIAPVAASGADAPSELVLPMVHSVPGQYRTNLGLVQTAAGSYQVEVTLYTASGSQLASKRYTIGAAYRQISNLFANMGVGSRSVEGGWIRVRLLSSAKAGFFWTCYASVIDQRTGDPTYVNPR